MRQEKRFMCWKKKRYKCAQQLLKNTLYFTRKKIRYNDASNMTFFFVLSQCARVIMKKPNIFTIFIGVLTHVSSGGLASGCWFFHVFLSKVTVIYMDFNLYDLLCKLLTIESDRTPQKSCPISFCFESCIRTIQYKFNLTICLSSKDRIL